MNQQMRIGKTAQTPLDGRPKTRRRRLADSVREVMTVLASATLVAPAQAADADKSYSNGPYLQLRSGHDITTEKGYYESTGQGPMYSAIRVLGPNSLIHIFDSTMVGLYWHAHALYVTKRGKADAHDSIFRAEGKDTAAVWADGASIDVERSSVETLGDYSHGIEVTGKGGHFRFAGGKIFTQHRGASAARADDGATLVLDKAVAKEGTPEDPPSSEENDIVPVTDGARDAEAPASRDRGLRTHLRTEGTEAPAVSVLRGATISAQSADLETYGSYSPVVRLGVDSRGVFRSSTFKVAPFDAPVVSMAEGATFELHDSTIDTGRREAPIIEASGNRQLVGLYNARLVGRTLLVLKSYGETSGELTFRIGRGGVAIGEVEAYPRSRLSIELSDSGRLEGRVIGDVDFEIASGGEAILNETTVLLSMSLAGRLQFSSNVAPGRGLLVRHSLLGQAGRLTLRTTANRGGALSEQETDRLIVEEDASGTVLLDVVPSGDGALTDSNSDGVIQADEGISLVQVGGKATPTSFALVGDYVAVGPYRYELASFAPGSSDAKQRLVYGDGNTFWDFRLANRATLLPPPPPPPTPVPEPEAVEPPPAPTSEPEVVEPPPAPTSEPEVVEPPPAPTPEPEVVEPPPAPTPEPEVVEPPPAPMPEPEVVEPPPAPMPEPEVVEPPPAPMPEPEVVEPPPAPMPEPEVVEPPPAPVPEPEVVEPPPTPMPEPEVVEPPPAPVPEPEVVEPPPAPMPEPEVVKPPPAPTPQPVVVEPQAKVDHPAAGSTGRTPTPLELVPQVAAYVAMPLAASGFLHDALRSWGHPHSEPAGRAHRMSGEHSRGFANAFGSRGRYEASGHEHAYRHDFSTRQHGMQFGLPVFRHRTANGTLQVDAGASAGDATFAIDVPRSQSRSRMRIAGVGLRVTHARHTGLYASGLLKIDHLGIDVRTRERSELASLGGIGVSALCEVGGMATFAGGWTVESSIRASYIDVRLRGFTDADRLSVKPQPFRTASAAITSRLSRSFAAAAGISVRPYVGAGLAYTSGPPSSQQIGRVPFASEPMTSSWEASAGFEGRFGKSARLLIDVAVQDGLDHGFSSIFATGSVQWIF